MANVQHSALTGAELHEPKGAAAASDDFVMTATSGAAVWKKLTTINLDTTAIFRTNKFVMNVQLADISTASSCYVVVPVAATLTKVWSVINGAITVGDAVITVKNQAGSTATTVTIANSGSAAGTVDSGTPASNNTFAAGERVTLTSDGGSTDTAIAVFTLEFTQTA